MAVFTLYAILFLGVTVVALWWTAYGYCRKCRLDRGPRCGCDPDNRRKPWKNSGK